MGLQACPGGMIGLQRDAAGRGICSLSARLTHVERGSAGPHSSRFRGSSRPITQNKALKRPKGQEGRLRAVNRPGGPQQQFVVMRFAEAALPYAAIGVEHDAVRQATRRVAHRALPL